MDLGSIPPSILERPAGTRNPLRSFFKFWPLFGVVRDETSCSRDSSYNCKVLDRSEGTTVHPRGKWKIFLAYEVFCARLLDHTGGLLSWSITRHLRIAVVNLRVFEEL